MISSILDTYIRKLFIWLVSSIERPFADRTVSARSCTFGFLWFNLRLRARIASLGCTCFALIWSHISRLRTISSWSVGRSSDVALSARRQQRSLLMSADDAHQLPRQIGTIPKSRMPLSVLMLEARWSSVPNTS